MTTLFVTDLDGTLLHSDKSVSDFTADTLNSLISRGSYIAYATARSFNSAAPIVRKVNFRIPCAVYNGVMLVDPVSGRNVSRQDISPDSVKLAREFFESEGISPIVYAFVDGKHRISYIPSDTAGARFYLADHRGDPRMRETRDFNELFMGEIFYFTVISERKIPELAKVFTHENGFSMNVQKDNYDDMIWHEIYDLGCSKANAALRLKELCGAEKLVCFGDNFNDVPMLEAADIAVCVGNAPDEVKRFADVVADTNDRDGVAGFIAEYASFE